MLIAALLAPVLADAHWFGFAFNAFSGNRSFCFVTRPGGGGRGFRITGDRVQATLVCRRPAACNGRRGRIDGTLDASLPARLEGTLSYGGALACTLECDVNALPGDGPRTFWSCIYNCPAPARVAVGTFTIQRR